MRSTIARMEVSSRARRFTADKASGVPVAASARACPFRAYVARRLFRRPLSQDDRVLGVAADLQGVLEARAHPERQHGGPPHQPRPHDGYEGGDPANPQVANIVFD